MSSPKDRHYQQLASKLQVLSKELRHTQEQFSNMARELQSVSNLGAIHAAQFMAVSRLLDAEMMKMDGEREGTGVAA